MDEWPKRPNHINHKTHCVFETSSSKISQLLCLFVFIKGVRIPANCEKTREFRIPKIREKSCWNIPVLSCENKNMMVVFEGFHMTMIRETKRKIKQKTSRLKTPKGEGSQKKLPRGLGGRCQSGRSLMGDGRARGRRVVVSAHMVPGAGRWLTWTRGGDHSRRAWWALRIPAEAGERWSCHRGPGDHGRIPEIRAHDEAPRGQDDIVTPCGRPGEPDDGSQEQLAMIWPAGSGKFMDERPQWSSVCRRRPPASTRAPPEHGPYSRAGCAG